MKRIIFLFLLISFCFVSCENKIDLQQDEVIVKKDTIVNPSKNISIDSIILPMNPKPR